MLQLESRVHIAVRTISLIVACISTGGCSGHGVCPPHGLMLNGATCNGDDLQCAHEVTLTACDGTQATVVSSCACTDGKWDCPEPGTSACTDGGTSTATSGGASSTTTAKKPPRSSGSSCPFVFVWNGSSFEYETDLAGITIGLPPGTTANAAIPVPSAGNGYARLPHAKLDPANGLEIHLRETVREISYLDLVRLLVVDVPAGYEVYDNGSESTNEWGYVNPLSLYTSKNARAATAGVNQDGLDVTKALSDVDDSVAPIGDNSLDSYVLDFGPILHPEWAKLLIDGWSIYAISSDRDVQPFVEAQDANGRFTTVKKFGAPYGDFKTVVVDLSGLLPANVRQLRLNLGLENGARWVIDRIRLDDTEPVPISFTYADPTAATLSHRGRATLHRCTYLSRAEALDDENPDDPEQYGYGNFTRYGDVLELTNAVDDRYVVMRHGDQVQLQFAGLAAPTPGTSRTVFLQSDVIMKSFILGKDAGPLPFHGMSSYPYPSTEIYPSDAVHQSYVDQYNTRSYQAP
jgi:hypothetical protein